ncbi:MAG: 2-hydroxyacid dehydrogenase [Acidimicrobiales bacterium]
MRDEPEDDSRSRVALTRSLPDGPSRRLARYVAAQVWSEPDPPTDAWLRASCVGAAGLLVTPADRVGEDLLLACPTLRVVSNLAVGTDNVDVAALTRRGVPLGNTPGVLTAATADLAFALVLAASRRLVEARDAVLDGRWRTWDPGFMLGLELSGATIGILGAGRIGTAVARRALAFDMRVLAWSRSGRPLDGTGVERVEMVGMDRLLRESDVVSVHVALDASTVHLVGAEQLASMKPTAVLVNTARGPVVDQRALLDALVSGRIAAAGLDVVEHEPIDPGDPLVHLPNCIVLPHIGSATVAARAAMAELAVDNLLAGVAGERLPSCVNPEVYGV